MSCKVDAGKWVKYQCRAQRKQDIFGPHGCVLSSFSPVQLFVILWTVAHQAPLPMGFSRQQYFSQCPSPRDLSTQGSNPIQGLNLHLLSFLHWQGCSLLLVLPGKPRVLHPLAQLISCKSDSDSCQVIFPRLFYISKSQSFFFFFVTFRQSVTSWG